MLANLAYISLFAIIWGSLILISYRLGYLDGKSVALSTLIKKEDNKEQPPIKEQNRINAILNNINNYDGTDLGQEDVSGKEKVY